ncbi:S8 family serine peptidase [Streptomyces sp. KR80]|uniref:S8 family serine peptidase n=1 Tax=Streptomyces sp. KR80 TaxID=3457426 RepID=UPI003FCF5040
MRLRAVAILSSAVLLATAVPASEAVARPDEPVSVAAAAARANGAVRTVTLITGDRVHVTGRPGAESVSIEPAAGREHIAFVRSARRGPSGSETSVIPADAASLLSADRLDSRLFNVTRLVRDGFTDKSARHLPLLVRYARGAAKAATAPPAVKTTRKLPSINGAAVREDKQHAATFWKWLTGDTKQPRTLTAGVAKVWLDGMAHPTLAESVPQIGAPAAWQAGFTGAGVNIGVLDTGIKADHPDLTGRVVESKDFTGVDPAGGDEIGHGTHVAGIIAGTGAASNGKYRGVAPDAMLVNGKVCMSEGCPDSAIIAGMEWIAPKAKAVNMSLGGGASDGTDPIEVAVNELTAKHGTLFVIAAGNEGPRAYSVSSPSTADAALSVGSVTKQDETSSFSSRGPRVGNHAVKPDIGGPGSGIVAARAKGTPVGDHNPVDDNYAKLNGTSMATPHVAGAAAILAQQHADWSATQLKPALMSTAKPTAGILDQGAGRVDVGRAVKQRVWATGGSLSYGFFPWPHSQEPVVKKVTYRNDGDADATLKLDLAVTGPDGKPAPAGLFTASASEVTVPAHGTAEVAIAVKPSAGVAGFYGGRLTATAGDTVVQTALGTLLEPESYTLTVRDSGLNGKFQNAFAQLVNTTTGEVRPMKFNRSGVATARLVKGDWDVNVLDVSSDPGNTQQPTVATVMSRANVALTEDTSLTFDPAAGKPVEAVVDQVGAKRQFGELGLYSGSEKASGVVAVAGTPRTQLRAVPSGIRVTDHRHAFFFGATLASAAPDSDPAGSVYHLAFWKSGGVPADTTFRVADSDLATVDAHYHTQGAKTDFAVRSDFARYPFGAGSGKTDSFSHALPSRRTEYYTAGPDVTWAHLLQVSTSTSGDYENHRSYRSYQPGRYRSHWNAAPIGPAFGDPSLGWGVFREGPALKVGVSLFSSSDPHVYNGVADGVTGKTTLSRDGTVIGTSKYAAFGRFEIPDSAGTYTLHATATREVPWSVVGTKADVTWTFDEPGASAPAKPLPLLVVRATGEVDEQSRAPAGRLYPLVLTAQSQPGAPAVRLAALKVEASYDDGATWTPARTSFSGNRGGAVLNHPAGDGYVSLRITAEDVHGNAVTQTITRAYQTIAGR